MGDSGEATQQRRRRRTKAEMEAARAAGDHINGGIKGNPYGEPAKSGSSSEPVPVPRPLEVNSEKDVDDILRDMGLSF